MARLIGLLMLVAGIWTGVQIYTEGVENAFDGALEPWLAQTEPGLPPVAQGHSAIERAGEAVTQAHLEAAERRESLMAQLEE